MSTVAVVAAVVTGGVLLASGGAKLARPSWVDDAAELGVGRTSAGRGVVRLVPAAEIVIGAMLVVGIAPRLAATAAFVLLAAFSAVLARALRGGRRPPCACFGAWSRRPITWWLVVRNVLLAALAVLAAAR